MEDKGKEKRFGIILEDNGISHFLSIIIFVPCKECRVNRLYAIIFTDFQIGNARQVFFS